LLRCVPDGVVVVALDLDDLRTVTGDRIAPPLADGLVHVDHAAATEQPGTPGDRTAVIAVGGAADRFAADDVTVRARQQIGRSDRVEALCARDLAAQDLR